VGGTDAGVWCQGPNWLSNLMPQMEQLALAEKLYGCLENESSACDDCDRIKEDRFWREFGILKIEMFRCPSAVASEELFDSWSLEHLAKGNYAANFGSDTFVSFQKGNTAGAFGVIVPKAPTKPVQTLNHPTHRGRWKAGWGAGTKLKDFVDGSSQTLLLSEVLTNDDPADGRGVWTWVGMGASTFTAKLGPNSKEPDVIPACNTKIPTPDRMYCTQNRANGNVWAAARSEHSGGVNASMADGSVHFFSDSIDITIWRAMSTRAGEEPVTVP
jgi:prepilin-type processing-associated H-X9-DG protein